MTTATIPLQKPALTRADFASDQTVRWCPGCGDYAILATMQKIDVYKRQVLDRRVELS